MKLQQLKYLLAIVDNGLNVTAAASRLYTSQPGVSKQLKLLEEELGLQLFTRKGKSLECVTSAGEKVVEHARIVLQEVDNIRGVANAYYQDGTGTLSIAATHTQARYVLPEILKRFRDLYPKISVNLHQGTTEQIEELISISDVDIAITTGPYAEINNLLLIPAYRCDKKILVPEDHPLAKLARDLELEDLENMPLVSYVISSECERQLKALFDEKGMEANVAFTARDADVVKTYVKMGMGVGIIAGLAYEQQEDVDLVALNATKIFPCSTTWVAMRRSLPMRRYISDFISLFAPHIQNSHLRAAFGAQSQHEVDAVFSQVELPSDKDGIGQQPTQRAARIA